MTDRDVLREKYALERAKRLRADGNDQYVAPQGTRAHYLDDPYAEPVEREPVCDEVTVAVIGGGFAGLITGARLRQAGVAGVRLVEKGGDVGGTWYWNRYPGAQCDTHSFVYVPLLEETGHMPTEKYAPGPEIREQCRRIARRFGLYHDALLSTEVTALEWEPERSRWLIRTNRGDAFRAQFVTMGTGPLHRPKLPGIPGLESFRGHSFHTSRWDYDYTGGDAAGAPMDRLAGRRVGVIGTGATSVQCVPHLARACGELYVFQRTPSSIDVRANEPTDPEQFAAMAPGWQEEWLRNFATLQTGGFAEQDLVHDGWTDIARRIRARVLADPAQDFSPEGIARAFEECDHEKMEEIRARVDAVVADAVTAQALKPWYRQLCKRPCFSDAYLDAFNVPGTHLVDTDGRGVERITERGVVAAGREYELDCLVYASGFEVGTDYTRRAGYDPVGRGGRRLSEHWADGLRTLHGIHVHGFPNLFVVAASQAANLISNYPHNLQEAARTVAAVVAHALEAGVAEVEPTEQAEREWVELVVTGARRPGGLSDAECTPGYYNNEGHPLGLKGQRNAGAYPHGPLAFFEHIDRWRSSGELPGLDLRPAAI
jgi:cation diffusion facilitator CzcD-associated flavoprotein CzcO